MKWMWRTKQFTLVFIPEANKRTRRFKIPKFMLYALPISVCLLAGYVILVIHTLQLQSIVISHELHSRLAAQQTQSNGQKEQLKLQISSKEQQIEDLQKLIIDLSNQEKQFNHKLAEIQKINQKLSQFTSMTDIDPSQLDTSLSAAANVSIGLVSPPGEGGESISVANDQIIQLADRTKVEFAALNSQLSRLIGSLSDAEQALQEIQRQQAFTPSIWPARSRRINSGYGIRIDPFTRRPSFHNGVDIAGKLNDPVFTAADGTVVYTGKDNLEGNQIIIDHGNGLRTIYMHLNKILVKDNANVVKGQKIGLIGSTGRSTGPHLHYEVKKNNNVVSPLPYLP